MPAFKSNKHSVETGPVVVTAATLKEAYQIVRQDHGPDTVILGSRSITRRKEKGLGHEKMVEVTDRLGHRPRCAGPQRIGVVDTIRGDRPSCFLAVQPAQHQHGEKPPIRRNNVFWYD